MTIENLLKPRYKVIATMPFGKFEVGDILLNLKCTTRPDQKEGEYIWMVVGGRFGGKSVGIPMIKDPEKYPHLFQKLQWWQYREDSDMPKYVKWTSTERKGMIQKSIFNRDKNEILLDGDCMTYTSWIVALWPATEQEYNDYIRNNT